ncbi:MAG: serine/threonine protein phosphatase [Bacillales bacterium]|jgi:predicted MPP superfamily phosphohydrolase|nr:serine/threonine protein phosphatase [Bacillales bacterium]
MVFAIFAIFAISLVLLVHYYVGRRFFQWIKLFNPSFPTLFGWGILVFLISCVILSHVLPTSWFTSPLAWVGSYWLGILFYTLLFLFLLEFIRILSLVKLIPRTWIRTKRMQFAAGIIGLCFILGIVSYGSFHANQIKVNKYDISIKKSETQLDSLKLVMISDIHLGYVRGEKDIKRIVEKINALNPDIVCIPGDIFDGNADALNKQDETIEHLKKIRSKYGVYASLGNHDAGNTYASMISFIQKSNIQLLQDESVVVDGQFTIVGMKDLRPIGNQESKRSTIKKVVSNVDKSKPVILLDHQPSQLQEAAESGVDLMLSGHTHRGQIFPFNYVTQANFMNDWGYLKVKSLQSVVTSGVGTWGPPLRIGSNSEIVMIDIKFE